MDSFDYDCLEGLDQFCRNEEALEQKIKKASESVGPELLDGELAKSPEDILSGYREKECKDKADDSVIDVENIDPCGLQGCKNNELLSNSATYKNNELSFLDDLEKTLSFSDDESENIIMNVQWKNKIEKIQHRKFQKFVDLMNNFAKLENCSVNDILFNIDDKIISPDDTPHSINYKFYDIICGRVVPNSNLHLMKKENKNSIKLKIQSSDWRKAIEISIDKNENFSILCAKLAEEIKLDVKNFTIIFDGEPMDLTETPQDLDFEGGELIDCKIKCQSKTELKRLKKIMM